MSWIIRDASGGVTTIPDPADFWNARISLTHVATGASFENLPIMLANVEEQYKPTFKKESVYGRMDPIPTYQNTTRDLTIGFVIHNKSYSHQMSAAILSDLIKMLYPLYSANKAGTGYLAAAPLLRVKLHQYTGAGGVLAVINSFNISKYLDKDAAARTLHTENTPGGAIYPNSYTITMGLSVIHEGGKVGWVYDPNDSTIKFGQGGKYPMGEDSFLATNGAPVVASQPVMLDTRGLTENENMLVENIVDQFSSPASGTPMVDLTGGGATAQVMNED